MMSIYNELAYKALDAAGEEMKKRGFHLWGLDIERDSLFLNLWKKGPFLCEVSVAYRCNKGCSPISVHLSMSYGEGSNKIPFHDLVCPYYMGKIQMYGNERILDAICDPALLPTCMGISPTFDEVIEQILKK